MPELFNWTRFWAPSTVPLRQDGYLYDPQRFAGNPNIQPFTEISHIPCLILLGLPGLGKSSAIKQIVATYGASGCLLNLGDFATEDGLERELDIQEPIVRWAYERTQPLATGVHPIDSEFTSPITTSLQVVAERPSCHIFLDSLDEGMLQISRLAPFLDRYIGKLKRSAKSSEGLFVRIICRSTEVPHDLLQRMLQHWQGSNLQVYHLAQLRRLDVEKYAASKLRNEAEVQLFIDAIEERDVATLAAHPITLEMLLELFVEGGALPSSRAELYLKGILKRVSENNERRLEEQRLVPIDRRMTLASQFAAITVLSGYHNICLDDLGIPGSLYIADALPIPQRHDREVFAEASEVLASSVFISPDRRIFQWSHISFAEFLAAKLLADTITSLDALKQVVSETSFGVTRIGLPMLEISAWLAELRPEILHWLTEVEPQLIARRRHLLLSEENRKLLIDNAVRKFSDRRFQFEPYYVIDLEHLCYPSIAEQLNAYISDRTLPTDAREFVMKIASSCKVVSLVPKMTELSLDITEDIDLRIAALYALRRIDIGHPAISELKRLMQEPNKYHATETVQVIAVGTLWPNHISPEEYFAFLGSIPETFDSPELDSRRELMYASALDALNTEGLIVALQWVARQQYQYDRGEVSGSFFVIDIMQKAWDYLRDDAVVDAFSRAAWTHIVQGNHFLNERSSLRLRNEEVRNYNHELAENGELRHRLMRSLLKTIPPHLLQKTSTDISTSLLWDFRKELPGLLSPHDYSWYLDNAEVDPDPQRVAVWIGLACATYQKAVPQHRTAMRKLANKSADASLLSSLQSCLSARRPSARTQRLIRKHNKEEQLRRTREEEILRQKTERLELWLGRTTNQDTGWFELCDALFLGRYVHLIWDITETSGWQRISSDMVAFEKVKQVAIRCVTTYKPRIKAADESILYTDFFGYTALLHTARWELHSELEPTIWRQWLTAILVFRNFSILESLRDSANAILVTALEVLNEEFWSILSTVVKDGLSDYQLDGILRVTYERNVAQLPEFIEQQLSWPIESVDDRYLTVLRYGMKVAVTRGRARDIAVQIVLDSNFARDVRRNALGNLCFEARSSDWWDRIWPLVSQDTTWFDEPSPLISHGENNPYFQWLTVDQLISLYMLAVEIILYPDDIDFRSGAVPWRYSQQRWREGILDEVSNRGTVDSIDFLKAIGPTHPHPRRIGFLLHTAQERLRMGNWMTLTPTQVLTLLTEPQKSIVRDADQLLNRLIETLGDIERDIRGRPTLQLALWNGPINGAFQPRSEGDISDVIADQLRTRLSNVFINREVEVRQDSFHTGRGNTTDILVNAASNDGVRLSVIIEVKGSWNRDLNAVVQSQLIDRYLASNIDCDHGLVLVAHFASTRWNTNDWRRGRSRKMSRAVLMIELDRQIGACTSPRQVAIRPLVIEITMRS